MYLALDSKTNDIYKPVGGGVTRITNEGRFVVQQVRCKLRTWLGEWLLDQSKGWLSHEDFEKNYDAFNLEFRAREIILATQGVLAIDEINSSYSNRKLTITFKARSIYGIIELTVPWEA